MTRRPSLSQQLRKAIEASGTSRYALARQLGVAESTLSRFMAGKQGLTLATLDELARVLGLDLIQTVQQVPRSKPRGRPKAAGRRTPTEKATVAPQNWVQFASMCAVDAHNNWFSSRRGTWYIEDRDVVVLFNNNPYSGDATLRDEELAEFRAQLAAEGIKELAFASYPETGYTYAMVIDASRDQERFLADLMAEITSRTLGRAIRRSPPA